MPWKTEIDRLVHHLVLDSGQGGSSDVKRAVRTVADLTQLAPDRGETHFHTGALEELVHARAPADEAAEEAEDRSAWLEGLRGEDLVKRIWRAALAGVAILAFALLMMFLPSFRPTGAVAIVVALVPAVEVGRIALAWLNER